MKLQSWILHASDITWLSPELCNLLHSDRQKKDVPVIKTTGVPRFNRCTRIYKQHYLQKPRKHNPAGPLTHLLTYLPQRCPVIHHLAAVSHAEHSTTVNCWTDDWPLLAQHLGFDVLPSTAIAECTAAPVVRT